MTWTKHKPKDTTRTLAIFAVLMLLVAFTGGFTVGRGHPDQSRDDMERFNGLFSRAAPTMTDAYINYTCWMCPDHIRSCALNATTNQPLNFTGIMA